MKNLKKVLSLMLVLAMTVALCACGADNSVTKEEVAQMIEDANEAARAAGYFEGLSDGLNRAENFICDCPSCTNSTLTTNDTDNTTDNTGAEPEVVKAEHLPILMTYIGTWLDQNGDPMSYADAERFFKCNREYAKVAVAINSLCEELQSDLYRHDLETVHDWATASPHNTDEYLAYEWILSEMEANYDNYLNDLLALIGDQIDLDSSPAANVATCIILEKMLEFRDNGTYEASINPHRKHDCEAEGCNRAATVALESDIYYYNPSNPINNAVLNSLPVMSDVMELVAISDAEIATYLDEQNTGSITQFDLQHPTIYFDRLGRVHGALTPDEEYYYATSSGNVYKLNSHTDIDRIGESPLFDASLCGTYVGTTNRILK